MWEIGWRDRIWSELDQPFDLIVIGGGITGAGILREASRAGLRTLLVEARDFASGTSSRSSKLVHGGLRYLKNAQFKLTMESVRERQRLHKEGPGLIAPLGFLFTSFRGDFTPGWVFGAGLIFYDLLASRWDHEYEPPEQILRDIPFLNRQKILGGHHYYDAQTDDARLVIRVIREGAITGGIALNYAQAIDLLKCQDGSVAGIVLQDLDPNAHGRTCEVRSKVTINATGVWADSLRARIGGSHRLRKLRGSHLVFTRDRLPLHEAISFLHPRDQRPLFAFPWEGVTLLGTTDVDHSLCNDEIETDPGISSEELEYLLEASDFAFPDLRLTEPDILSTFSGIRSVVDTGKKDPSKESREFILWNEHGLLTITGGKLTTFRLMAHQALHAVQSWLPGAPKFDSNLRVLDDVEGESVLSYGLPSKTELRLLGRYGNDAPRLLSHAKPDELTKITPEQLPIWAELRWAARDEGIVHLDDLLLRRLRIGLTLPCGGIDQLKTIQSIVQPELQWDEHRWTDEVDRYIRIIQHSYSLPSRSDIVSAVKIPM